MTRYFSSFVNYAAAHKVLSGAAIIALLGGGYWTYSKLSAPTAETRYVLGTVDKGTIISTISGSGQVSSSNQIDVKPKVSGDVTSINVKPGQTVSRGRTLATIDATDALQAVTNAKLDLDESRLTLQQSTSQAPIDYQKTQDAVTDANSDLSDEYEAAYTAIGNAFVTLPAVMSEADNLLYDSDVSPTAQNVNAYQNLFISSDETTQRTVRTSANRAIDDYTKARDAYTSVYANFKTLSLTSSPTDIEKALTDTETAAKLISQALVSEVNLIDGVVDQINLRDWTLPAAITTQQSSAHSQLTTSNSVLSSLSGEVQSLRAKQKALVTAKQNLDIAGIGNPNGDNPFSLQLQKNDVAKKQAALADAQQALADHSVRAPFDGVVASVDINDFESVSSATTILSLITKQKTAVLSLNEVDAAKVAVGNKATLTFDAIDDLTISGEVVEIDAVGTVSQGVVSYSITIGFDTQDDRVKPGMTVNASVITQVKQDVLKVPSSAVKTQGENSFVQVFTPALQGTGGTNGVTSATAPQQVPVVIGISDDTSVEIVSGLSEGEQIVTRTITGTATTNTTTATTGAGGRGFGGPGGGIRL